MVAVLRAAVGLALPLLTCVVLVLACATYRGGWRRGVLGAALVVGGFVWATTELLSTGRWLRPVPLAAAWSVLLVGAAVVIARQRRSGRRPPRLRAAGTVGWVAYGALVTALVGAVAVLSPPNNFDSMAYHLTRVAHWAQSGSVAFFATNDERQLYMLPWSEYAVAHLVILAGGVTGGRAWCRWPRWWSALSASRSSPRRSA